MIPALAMLFSAMIALSTNQKGNGALAHIMVGPRVRCTHTDILVRRNLEIEKVLLHIPKFGYV